MIRSFAGPHTKTHPSQGEVAWLSLEGPISAPFSYPSPIPPSPITFLATPTLPFLLALLHCIFPPLSLPPPLPPLLLPLKSEQNKTRESGANPILLAQRAHPGEGSRREPHAFALLLPSNSEQIESRGGVCPEALCKSTPFVITRTNPTFEVFPSCYKGNVFCLIHFSL